MVPARILVVDDDDASRYAAEKVLLAAGYEVESARDYRAALPLLEKAGPFDLLFTDVVMPGAVNGFALARMARMRCLNLKILYATAFDVPTDEALGKILRKPISDDELVKEVRLALAA